MAFGHQRRRLGGMRSKGLDQTGRYLQAVRVDQRPIFQGKRFGQKLSLHLQGVRVDQRMKARRWADQRLKVRPQAAQKRWE